MMNTIYSLVRQYTIGGLCYLMLEVAWRGFSHFSMFLLGGLCFVLLLRLYHAPFPFFIKCLVGALAITAAELIVGFAVNIWLGLNVWDYSGEAYNLAGQICLRYCALWYCLCGIVYALLGFVERCCASRRRGIIRIARCLGLLQRREAPQAAIVRQTHELVN